MGLTIRLKERSKQATSLKVIGEVDIFTVDRLLATIDACSSDMIQLDFSGVKFIDSTGIGMLLRKFLELVEHNRKLVFDSIPEHIHEVFDEVGFFQIMQEMDER